MKKLLPFCATLLLLLVVSCNKWDSDDCDPDLICYTQRPDSLYIELQLSPINFDDTIEVNFYEGNIDDADPVYSFITTAEKEYFHVPVRERFSATARYKRGESHYTTVDGLFISVDSYTNCDQQCYNWDDKVFDLKLSIDED